MHHAYADVPVIHFYTVGKTRGSLPVSHTHYSTAANGPCSTPMLPLPGRSGAPLVHWYAILVNTHTQVLQSEVRLRGGCADLLGQLQAVAELWDELQAVWDSPYCAARPVPVPVPVPAPAPEAMEEDAGPGPSR